MKKISLYQMLMLIIGVALVTACQTQQDEVEFRSDEDETADTSTDSGDDTTSDDGSDTEEESDNEIVEDPDTGETVEEEFMSFTAVVPLGSNAIMHKYDEALDSECKISVDDDPTDIRCIVEGIELALYASGASFAINYNIPEGLCKYFEYRPYFFYQRLAGPGPSLIERTTTDGVSVITNIDEVVPEISAGLSSGGNVICPAVYIVEEEEVNCCDGEYTLRDRVIDNSVVPPSDTTTVTTDDWGGNRFNCLAGPAVTTQVLDANDKPMGTIIDMEGIGLNRNYEITSPISSGYLTNLYIANYFDISDSFATDGVDAAFDWDTAPVAIQGTEADDEFDYYGGNPWYDFGCFDEGHDYIHRVRIMIRAWSSEEQYEVGLSGVYNQSGDELYFTEHSLLDYDGWFTTPEIDYMTEYPNYGL